MLSALPCKRGIANRLNHQLLHLPQAHRYCDECCSITLSGSAADQLAAGESRCRDAGDNEGRRNHESNDQLTHVSFLH
jgi:hypothetical protein